MSATSAALVRRTLTEHFAETPPAELLARYADRRDPDAFAGLVRQFGPLVLGVCRRVLGPSPDADDAFQAVFVALARQAYSFRDPRALPAWLHRVALRTARKARARCPAPPSDALHGPGVAEPTGAADPLAAVAWKDVRRVLDEELDALPERLRAPVVLCWLDGLTQDEAAGRLGVSLNTLKRRLVAGRDLLRVRLARRGLAPVVIAAAVVAPTGLRADVPRALASAAAGAVRGLKPAAHLLPRLAALATVVVAAACGLAFVAPSAPPEAAPAPRSTPPPERAEERAGLPPGAATRFGTAQFNVEGGIGASALSSDGKRLAVACGSSVQVYEAATWRLVQTLSAEGVADGTWQRQMLAFASDGQRLAYAKNGRTAFAWNLKTGALTHRFDSGHDAAATGRRWQPFCAFTPDGQLALADRDKLRYFDPDTGAEKRAVAAAQMTALSPNGKYLVRFASSGEAVPVTTQLVLGDAATGKDLYKFNAPSGWSPEVSFSPDGKRFALVPLDGGQVEVWDADARDLVKCLKASEVDPQNQRRQHPGGLTPDGSEVWLVLPNSDVARWNATTYRELPPLVAGTAWSPDALFPLADGRTLLGPCGGGWVRVFDRETGKERTIPDRYSDYTSFAVSPTGEFVAVGDRSGRIDLLDPATGKRVRSVRESGPMIHRLLFSPDGGLLGVHESTGDSTKRQSAVRAFRVSDGKAVWGRTDADETEKDAGWTALVGFTAAGAALVEYSQGGHVRAWDTKTGKELYRISANLRAPAATAPGGKVVAADVGGEVVLFDLGTGRETKRVEIDPEDTGPQRAAGSRLFAWSGDGHTLVVTLPEDNVCVLDLATGAERTRFPVYAGKVDRSLKTFVWANGGHSVNSLALSPDGKRLLAAAINGTYVALWDVRTGKQLARLEAGNSADTVAFSPDGKSAFTFSNRGTGYRWDVEQVIAAQK
jgi:RNA polymerase sigma factor (sigma-70 family)